MTRSAGNSYGRIMTPAIVDAMNGQREAIGTLPRLIFRSPPSASIWCVEHVLAPGRPASIGQSTAMVAASFTAGSVPGLAPRLARPSRHRTAGSERAAVMRTADVALNSCCEPHAAFRNARVANPMGGTTLRQVRPPAAMPSEPHGRVKKVDVAQRWFGQSGQFTRARIVARPRPTFRTSRTDRARGRSIVAGKTPAAPPTLPSTRLEPSECLR